MAKTIRKRRAPQTGLIVSVLVGVILVGGGAYAWFFWLRPTPPLEEAEEAMRKIMTATDIADIKPLLTKRSLRQNRIRLRFGNEVVSLGWEKWLETICRGNAKLRSLPHPGIQSRIKVGKATLKGREAWVPVTNVWGGLIRRGERRPYQEYTEEWVFVCERSQWRLDVRQNMQRQADRTVEAFEKPRQLGQDLGYEAEE